jgi:hypothetical protein
MKDMTKRAAERPSDATAVTPFFARFLEDQHGRDAGSKPSAANQTLKYPSDRDEEEFYSPIFAEAATIKVGPSRMTLKYPSDRDEIDPDAHSA